MADLTSQLASQAATHTVLQVHLRAEGEGGRGGRGGEREGKEGEGGEGGRERGRGEGGGRVRGEGGPVVYE